MNSSLLLVAAVLSAITTVAHIAIGGRKNAAPVFRQPDLPTGPKVTVEFAWNAASVFLFFVTIIFAWAALNDSGRVLVVFTVAHCASLAGLGFYSAYRSGFSPWAFPPAILFALISLAGSAALIGAP